MLRWSELSHRQRLPIALVVLCGVSFISAPVSAQSSSSAVNEATSATGLENAPTQGASTVVAVNATTPSATPTSERSAAEDAQLPAYLQDNPEAETENAMPDPWERYNRHVYRFNKKVDKRIAKPLAHAYQRVVPKPARTGVSHFFANLHQPVNAVNLLLQGHPGKAAGSLGRFVIDSTLGIGGLLDPATAMHVPQFNEDFGQTLGRWGWRHSRYLLVPFFGPGTLRDRIGALADSQISWNHYVEHDRTRVGLLGLSLIDKRVQLLPLDELSAGVDDDYVLVREAWGQRRNHQIDDQSLPVSDDAGTYQQ